MQTHRADAGTRSFEGREVELKSGGRIAARIFRPKLEARGVVLVVPAMGVAQTFYEPFASWLAGEGFVTLTFDYRGMGLSRTLGPASLKDLEVDLLDWAQEDCAAMVELARACLPGSKLTWLGHSLGGQILPFVPNRAEVDRMVTVATGSGYWRENSPRLRRVAGILWYGIVPVSMRLWGYFPGKRLRMVGDLPRGVMARWRRWCLHPEYAVGAEGDAVRELYDGVRTPIVSFSFTDDDFMSERNTASIHGHYRNAPRTMKRYSPEELGRRHVGHFGFFRPEVADCLWRPHLLPELGAA